MAGYTNPINFLQFYLTDDTLNITVIETNMYVKGFLKRTLIKKIIVVHL